MRSLSIAAPGARSIAAAGALFTLSLLPAAAADKADSKIFAVLAQNGSGESGAVLLTPVGDDKTRVEVVVASAPDGTAQPAHVHVGPCAKLDPKPKYPLKSLVNGLSVTTLDVPMATLTAGTFAVNVHKSATDLGTYVACGDLGTAAAPTPVPTK